ncbi:virion morphogenesis protein [Acidovorax sp. DW039]|uniref:PBECR2 nuclease fold domain-containing protein n=1 Tax=Acidovorax sp. DW039 TaxID=3095606 RepID=UPI003092A46F|nr:virion morphogenesis protein [Acidovorax sp. DW039]
MPSAAYGSLPFAEQAEFFRRKLNLPTDGWTDIYTREHDWAFVVAGANRDAIVADFRAAVEKAIEGGTTLEEFRKDFDRIVATHGWDYNGGRNWRSRVIYDTNLATSYAAGRWQQLQAAPYWQYEHQDWVQNPRPLHVSWDGLVLERDNPFWQTHFPPNGWGCHCKVRGLWPRDLQRLGKTGPDQAPEVNLVERTIGQRSINGPRQVQVPEGIDPGFEYAPGNARLKAAMPPPRSGGPAANVYADGLPDTLPGRPLPPPRRLAGLDTLPTDQPPEFYVNDFLARFGATMEQPVIFRDAVGEGVVIGKDLFTAFDGSWKVLKFDRDKYLPLLAESLKEPDEIWLRLEWMHTLGKAVVRRRYISNFAVGGKDTAALAVFERGEDGWTGVTIFHPGTVKYLNKFRQGVLLYRREA